VAAVHVAQSWALRGRPFIPARPGRCPPPPAEIGPSKKRPGEDDQTEQIEEELCRSDLIGPEDVTRDGSGPLTNQAGGG